MLTIRLSRIGKKKKPMYRLVISEKAKDPYGRALEILGSYDPFSKELTAKQERIQYWLGQGAQMSPTVNNLLIDKEIIKGEKIKASTARKKKKGGGEEAKAEAPAAGPAPAKEEPKPEANEAAAPAKEEVKEEPKQEAGQDEPAPAKEEPKTGSEPDKKAGSKPGEAKEEAKDEPKEEAKPTDDEKKEK